MMPGKKTSDGSGKGESVDHERAETAFRLTRGLLQEAGFGEGFPQGSDGSRSIILASLEDPMSRVFEAVHDLGPLTICARLGKTTLFVSIREQAHAPTEEEDTLSVHPDSSIGMFVAALLGSRGERVFHREDEMDDDRDLLLELV
jgi:hypothetical protein